MIAPIVSDGHTTTVEKGNCPWICLSSQLASCRSQNRTLIQQAVSLHACHLHSLTCLPSTEKEYGKSRCKNVSQTLALIFTHAKKYLINSSEFQDGWEHYKISQSSTRTEQANNLREHPICQSILFWRMIANSREKTFPLLLGLV